MRFRRVLSLMVLTAAAGALAACTSTAAVPATESPTTILAPTGSESSAPSAASAPAVSTGKSASVATVKPKPDAVRAVAKSTSPAKRPPLTSDPLVGGKLNTNPVIAVKIDNTKFNVPQFGVADADIVFVEQVEGGLTRLIAIFHSTLPTEVGPVRSVRSTDAQLLPVFGKPALVFSGGAGGPLADLAKSSILDTSGDVNAYFRSDAQSSPYNLHANLAQLLPEIKKQGIGAIQYVGLNFSANDPRVAEGAPADSITVVMESRTTSFSYTGGYWVRTRGGSPVSDFQGGLERADNVLVLHTTDTPDGTVDVVGSPSYLTHTVGHGSVTLFRDGRAIAGKWSRGAAGSPFVFTDNAGRTLPFKPGKSWIILAPQTAQVSTG